MKDLELKASRKDPGGIGFENMKMVWGAAKARLHVEGLESLKGAQKWILVKL